MYTYNPQTKTVYPYVISSSAPTMIHKGAYFKYVCTEDLYSKSAIIKRDALWRLHCADGPAVVDKNRKEWWLHGKRHREGGPAIINTVKHWLYGDVNTHMEWYHDDKKLPCNSQNEYIRYTNLKAFW